MALEIISPRQSFIQFGETGIVDHCIYGNVRFCLPVYSDDDIAFQLIVRGTVEEIDALCGVYGTDVNIGLVDDCDDEYFSIEFTANPYTSYQPEIYRLNDTQALINWTYGFPLFTNAYAIEECFRIRVQIGSEQFCSNCFKRTNDNCYTSVVEYSCDENAFGFNYCQSGAVDDGALTCEPTVVQFTNASILTIPYTAELMAKYGSAPTIQVWISDGTDLVNMGITATFDTYPPTSLNFDFGGPASGIVVIK